MSSSNFEMINMGKVGYALEIKLFERIFKEIILFSEKNDIKMYLNNLIRAIYVLISTHINKGEALQ